MLSPADMLLIGTAALLFFGPDQLPKVARRAGGIVRDVQATSQSFIREMERAAEDPQPADSGWPNGKAHDPPFAPEAADTSTAPAQEASAPYASGAPAESPSPWQSPSESELPLWNPSEGGAKRAGSVPSAEKHDAPSAPARDPTLRDPPI